jgi:hypothetical protein
MIERPPDERRSPERLRRNPGFFGHSLLDGGEKPLKFRVRGVFLDVPALEDNPVVAGSSPVALACNTNINRDLRQSKTE